MSSRTEPSRRNRRWIAGSVFVFALLIRLLHVWQIRDAPFFGLYMGDAADFHIWAQRIAAGELIGGEVFYHAPLYPYFLGGLYAALGNHPLIVRGVQAAIGALACAIVADATWRLSSRRAGVLAGVLMAVYAPAIFFASVVQDSALDALLASLCLWTLVESSEAGVHRPLLWLTAGAALGAFVLTRENAIVLAAPVLLWIGLRRRLPRGRRATLGATFVGGMALLLLPVAARNYAVGGEFHLTTYNLGANLYIGNNPQADGYYRPLRPGRGNPAFELRDAVQLAEQATGRQLSPREVSRHWAGRALDYVIAQPLDWLALLGRKLFLFWNASEIADTEDQYTYAEWSAPLAILGMFFHFGVLAPAALLGVLVTWEDRHRLWLFYALPAVYLASVVLFFVFARYRFPVVPFLVVLAAIGLDRLPRFVQSGAWTRLVALAMVAAAAAVPANWPISSAIAYRAHARANIGAALESRGRTDQARQMYREALQLDPRSTQGHFYLATSLHRQGRIEQALSHYESAARLDPANPRIRNNYASALVRAGHLDRAAEQLRRAIELEPAYADAGANLGLVLSMQGNRKEAVQVYRGILEAEPDHLGARVRLASTLWAIGRTEEAYRHYEQAAVVGAEETLKAMYHDAWELATDPERSVGEHRQALELALRAVALEPNGQPGPLGLRTLGAAYAANGRYREAVAATEAALRLAPSDEALASLLQGELASYRDGKPWWEG